MCVCDNNVTQLTTEIIPKNNYTIQNIYTTYYFYISTSAPQFESNQTVTLLVIAVINGGSVIFNENNENCLKLLVLSI